MIGVDVQSVHHAVRTLVSHLHSSFIKEHDYSLNHFLFGTFVSLLLIVTTAANCLSWLFLRRQKLVE